MKVQCQNCKLVGRVDDSKIPDDGIYVRCPKCKNRIFVKKETRQSDATYGKMVAHPETTQKRAAANHRPPIKSIGSRAVYPKQFGRTNKVLFGCLGAAVLLVIALNSGLFDRGGRNTPVEIAPLSQESAEESEALGISYDQVTLALSNYFTMKKSTPVDGKDRYAGSTSDRTAYLELRGDKDNISAAILNVGFPNDAPRVVVQNTGIMVEFLKSTIPEWEDSTDWATKALGRFRYSPNTSKWVKEGNKVSMAPDDSVETIKGNKTVKMLSFKRFGSVMVVVTTD